MDLVHAVLLLDGVKRQDFGVSVDFDDSIIHDTNTELEQNLKLVDAGLMRPFEFRMWWFNESEAQAKAKLAEDAGVPNKNSEINNK